MVTFADVPLWFHFSILILGVGFLFYFAIYYFSEIAFYFLSFYLFTAFLFFPLCLKSLFLKSLFHLLQHLKFVILIFDPFSFRLFIYLNFKPVGFQSSI